MESSISSSLSGFDRELAEFYVLLHSKFTIVTLEKARDPKSPAVYFSNSLVAAVAQSIACKPFLRVQPLERSKDQEVKRHFSLVNAEGL